MKYFRLSVLLFFPVLFLSGCNKGKSYLLKMTAEEMTKSCPREVDYMTTLESCEFVAPNTLKYNYITELDLDKIAKDQYCQNMESHIVQQMSVLMNKKESKALKSLDPILVHSYKTNTGELICEVSVTPEMYNNPIEISLLSDEEMYAELQQSAAILSPKEPVEMEEGFFLINVNAIAPRTLEFNYRMDDIQYTEFDTVFFKDALIPVLAEEIRIDQTDKNFKDNNVIFRYIYHDKDNNYLCSVNITPEDYQ